MHIYWSCEINKVAYNLTNIIIIIIIIIITIICKERQCKKIGCFARNPVYFLLLLLFSPYNIT